MIRGIVLFVPRVVFAVGCVVVILAATPLLLLLANRRPGDDR